MVLNLMGLYGIPDDPSAQGCCLPPCEIASAELESAPTTKGHFLVRKHNYPLTGAEHAV